MTVRSTPAAHELSWPAACCAQTMLGPVDDDDDDDEVKHIREGTFPALPRFHMVYSHNTDCHVPSHLLVTVESNLPIVVR